MAKRHRLVMKGGPQVGTSFELDSPLVSMGRYSGNIIAVADEQVSRHHARLTRTEEGYRVEDLNSVNGVFINDQRIVAPRLLIPGDELRLGKDIKFLYETFTEYDAVPAFAGVEPVADARVESPTMPVISDKGATVYQKAAELPHSRVERSRTGASIPWLWVILIGGGIVLVVIVIVLFASGG
jgi:pSer/pThr/pTyr-binding forkhead associated (FHA) protein